MRAAKKGTYSCYPAVSLAGSESPKSRVESSLSKKPAVVAPESGLSLRPSGVTSNSPVFLEGLGAVVELAWKELKDSESEVRGESVRGGVSSNSGSDDDEADMDALSQVVTCQQLLANPPAMIELIPSDSAIVKSKPKEESLFSRKRRRLTKSSRTDETSPASQIPKLALDQPSLPTLPLSVEELSGMSSDQSSRLVLVPTKEFLRKSGISISDVEPKFNGHYWVCPLDSCAQIISLQNEDKKWEEISFIRHLKYHQGRVGLLSQLIQQKLKATSLSFSPLTVGEKPSESEKPASSVSEPLTCGAGADKPVSLSGESTGAVSLLQKHGRLPLVVPKRVGESWVCPLDSCLAPISTIIGSSRWNRCAFSGHLRKHQGGPHLFILLVQQEFEKLLLVSNT